MASRFLLLVIAALLLSSPVRSGDMAARVGVAPVAAPGSLDGQMFSGEFGVLGEPARGTDTWVFEHGSFLSKSCVECGFPRSVYLAEAASGGLRFETQTSCPVSDATIAWEGTVTDGHIQGVYTWVKKRWYRTIRKQFWFRGERVAGPLGDALVQGQR